MHTTQHDRPEIEYLDGRAHRKVSPRRTHSLVQAALLRIFEDCAGERGEVGAEWRFKLGAIDETHTEFLPDVAFIANERLSALRGDEIEEPPLAPDVAAEIRSPSDDQRLAEKKIVRYLALGSVMVLDVDPSERRIYAHTRTGVRTYEQSSHFEHAAVPWLRFDVAAIFRKALARH